MVARGKTLRRPGQGGQATAAAAVLAVALAALAAGAVVKGDLLSPVKAAICRYNLALIDQAYDLFALEQGRPPEDVEGLLASRFRRPPRCPSGGKFVLAEGGEARCTVHDRQGPRIEELGVYRSVPDRGRMPLPELAFRREKETQVVFHARWAGGGLPHAVEVRWNRPDGRQVKVTRLSGYKKTEVVSILPLQGPLARALPLGEYRVALYLDGEPAGGCSFWLLE